MPPPVAITEIMEYKLYAFHMWYQHSPMRGLVSDLANLQEINITAYITSYYDIQESKDQDKEPIIKTPFPFRKIDKWAQFANILCNWMSTQFSVDHITSMVYMFRE